MMYCFLNYINGLFIRAGNCHRPPDSVLQKYLAADSECIACFVCIKCFIHFSPQRPECCKCY